MGIYCRSVADIVIAVVRRLCVVFVHIKARAGRAGVYLKTIVTCAINFLSMDIFRQWEFSVNGNFVPVGILYQWEFLPVGILYQWELFRLGNFFVMGTFSSWELFRHRNFFVMNFFVINFSLSGISTGCRVGIYS